MIELRKLCRIDCPRLNALTARGGVRTRDGVSRLLLSALMLVLAGCAGNVASSDDPNLWYNKTIVENITGRSDDAPLPAYASAGPAGSALAASPSAAGASVSPSELYRSDASCGGIVLGGARPTSRGASVAADAISLEMTECEVVRLAGPPDRIDIAANERGERFLTITYARPERPRVYRFAAGRLVSIEAPADRGASQRRPPPSH